MTDEAPQKKTRTRKRKPATAEQELPPGMINPRAAALMDQLEAQVAPSPVEPTDSEKLDAIEGLDTVPKLYSLSQRISWVRRNLPDVTKDATVDGKYQVITHENVNKFLRPLMVKAGLRDTMSLVWSNTVETAKTFGAKNLPVLHCRGYYDYMIINVENPDQIETIRVDGWGEDTADKGPGKASTYAFKRGRLLTFSIAAGDNEEGRLPEADLAGPRVDTINQMQADELMQKADDLFGSDSEKAIRHMCEHQAIMAKGGIAQIPAKIFPLCLQILDNWAKSRKHKADDVGDGS